MDFEGESAYCFARVKGYPFWPSKVKGYRELKGKVRKYKVIFYGTYQRGEVRGEDIFAYTENIKERIVKKLPKKYIESFNKGIAQIEEDLENFRNKTTLAAKQPTTELPITEPSTSEQPINNRPNTEVYRDSLFDENYRIHVKKEVEDVEEVSHALPKAEETHFQPPIHNTTGSPRIKQEIGVFEATDPELLRFFENSIKSEKFDFPTHESVDLPDVKSEDIYEDMYNLVVNSMHDSQFSNTGKHGSKKTDVDNIDMPVHKNVKRKLKDSNANSIIKKSKICTNNEEKPVQNATLKPNPKKRKKRKMKWNRPKLTITKKNELPKKIKDGTNKPVLKSKLNGLKVKQLEINGVTDEIIDVADMPVECTNVKRKLKESIIAEAAEDPNYVPYPKKKIKLSKKKPKFNKINIIKSKEIKNVFVESKSDSSKLTIDMDTDKEVEKHNSTNSVEVPMSFKKAKKLPNSASLTTSIPTSSPPVDLPTMSTKLPKNASLDVPQSIAKPLTSSISTDVLKPAPDSSLAKIFHKSNHERSSHILEPTSPIMFQDHKKIQKNLKNNFAYYSCPYCPQKCMTQESFTKHKTFHEMLPKPKPKKKSKIGLKKINVAGRDISIINISKSQEARQRNWGENFLQSHVKTNLVLQNDDDPVPKLKKQRIKVLNEKVEADEDISVINLSKSQRTKLLNWQENFLQSHVKTNLVLQNEDDPVPKIKKQRIKVLNEKVVADEDIPVINLSKSQRTKLQNWQENFLQSHVKTNLVLGSEDNPVPKPKEKSITVLNEKVVADDEDISATNLSKSQQSTVQISQENILFLPITDLVLTNDIDENTEIILMNDLPEGSQLLIKQFNGTHVDDNIKEYSVVDDCQENYGIPLPIVDAIKDRDSLILLPNFEQMPDTVTLTVSGSEKDLYYESAPQLDKELELVLSDMPPCIDLTNDGGDNLSSTKKISDSEGNNAGETTNEKTDIFVNSSKSKSESSPSKAHTLIDLTNDGSDNLSSTKKNDNEKNGEITSEAIHDFVEVLENNSNTPMQSVLLEASIPTDVSPHAFIDLVDDLNPEVEKPSLEDEDALPTPIIMNTRSLKIEDFKKINTSTEEDEDNTQHNLEKKNVFVRSNKKETLIYPKEGNRYVFSVPIEMEKENVYFSESESDLTDEEFIPISKLIDMLE